MGPVMSATLVVRHPVTDFAAWHAVYESLEPLRQQHGCTAKNVMVAPDDANDVFVTHDFPSVEAAGAFAHDPALKAGMDKAGVSGPPRIEIFTSV
jgi:quinol monooxygenase YgiN